MRRFRLSARGFLLAFALFTIPLAVLMAFAVVNSTLNGAGFAKQEQLKSQSFYVAESALNVAFNLFAANNFSSYTHKPDGGKLSSGDPNLLMPMDIPDLTLDSDGWYAWEWNPGDDIDDSFTRSGKQERYRFQILFPNTDPPGHYRIIAEAYVGRRVARHQLEGVVDSPLNYAIFDNGDLADFTRSSTERLAGKIHANGDMYLRPYKTDGLEKELFLLPDIVVMRKTNPTLEVFTDEMTAGGKVVRHTHIWSQSDDGGSVRVTNSKTGATRLMEGSAEGAYGKGNAYDSFHKDWTDTGSNGAISRWDGAVADRNLGSKVVAAPNRKTFAPGGYYASKATLTITSTTSASYVKDVTFYNQAEERLVTVKELDIQKMYADGAFPSKGLIYSEVPLRLSNGASIPAEFSVASASTVYIKGDFNKQFPNAAARSAGTPQHKPVSIMTSDRIYRLTESFKDTPSSYYPSLLELAAGTGMPEKSDPPLYPGDETDTLEVNAALIDGTPTNDVRPWVDDPDNSAYIPDTGIKNPLLGNLNRKVKQLPTSSSELKVAFPQSEDFLENLQNIKIRGTGSITHLRIADMAEFNNSDASNLKTPWIVKSFYIPPDDIIDGQIGVDFEYDPNLASAAGGLSAAPFAPKVAHKVRWTPLGAR